jgi:hypothetical protein
MKMHVMRAMLGGTLCLAWVGPLAAQDANWAEKMFDKLDHDFGVVARGSDARYRLAITNKYQQNVRISNVTTTCGCTAAKPSKETLASRETAYIELSMDTRKFTHLKESSVTVHFDQPLAAQVRIPVKAYIRTDVVLTPGGAEFGSVALGTSAERKIEVAYAGRNDWKIKNVISKNEFIEAQAVETSRNAGRVNYNLLVTLKGSAPAGELRGQLTLVTDDASNPHVPVLVEARIEPAYLVVPELVDFGTLQPRAKATKNIVVRGKKAFKIEKIESERLAGTFEARMPQEEKTTHVIPLTVTAPDEAGTISEEMTITIVGVEEPVRFRAYFKVASAATATGSASTGVASAGRATP